MAETSIRSLITERSLELREIDSLGPKRSAEILVELSSLLSSLNRQISESRYWLNVKKVEFLKEHGTASKARIYTEALPEYKDWLDRVSQGEAVKEMIRAIKFYLKESSEELREFTK